MGTPMQIIFKYFIYIRFCSYVQNNSSGFDHGFVCVCACDQMIACFKEKGDWYDWFGFRLR